MELINKKENIFGDDIAFVEHKFGEHLCLNNLITISSLD